MPTFKFTIADGKLFSDEAELPSEEAAWHEALRLVEDAKTSLKFSESWVLTVSESDNPLFRIKVTSEDLRTHKAASPQYPRTVHFCGN